MRVIVILSLLFIFSSSCKKKSNTKKDDKINSELQSGIGSQSEQLNSLLQIETTRIDGLSQNLSIATALFSSEGADYPSFKKQILGQNGVGLPVQEVVACGTNLTYGPALNAKVIYNSDLVLDPNATPSWKVVDADNFVSFETNLYRNFPSVNTNNFFPEILSTNSDFNLPLSPLVSNSDSIIFWITNNASQMLIQKRLSGATPNLLLNKTELQQLGKGRYQVDLSAINYSNQTVKGKRILFELGTHTVASFGVQ